VALVSLSVVAVAPFGSTTPAHAATTGSVYHQVRYPDYPSSWSGFGAVGLSSVSRVAVADDYPDTHVLAIRGGKIYHRLRQIDGSWLPAGQWGLVGNTGTATAVAAAADAGDYPYLHVVVGGGTAVSVGTSADPNGVLHLAAVF
jgi:hypothetical protein